MSMRTVAFVSYFMIKWTVVAHLDFHRIFNAFHFVNFTENLMQSIVLFVKYIGKAIWLLCNHGNYYFQLFSNTMSGWGKKHTQPLDRKNQTCKQPVASMTQGHLLWKFNSNFMQWIVAIWCFGYALLQK